MRLQASCRRILSGIDGAEDVYTTLNEGAQYYTVVVNRMEAGRLGLTVDAISNSLRTQIEGRTIGTALEEGRRTPILVRGSETTREAPTLLASLPLTLASGQHVALSQVARIHRVDGPVVVNRENGYRMSVVRANVRGRDMVGFVEAARQKVAAELPLPQGYRLTWGGQFENQQRAAARLSIVVPVAIGLIFVLLFTTFGSIRQALLVLVNIPFAVIGGVFALVLTGEYLSVPASVGFIALLGIAVLNGVVLVSYFNQLRAHGVPEGRIVVEGAKRRLRPVLMTASITALGPRPAAVCFRSRIGNSEAAGHRGDRRVALVDALDADPSADPLSPVWRRREGGQMSAEPVCLTLIAARELRDELFDYLSEQRDLVSGFTASDGAGHGPDVRLQTSAEQVKGHADEVMVRTILGARCRPVARPAQDGIRRIEDSLLDHAGYGIWRDRRPDSINPRRYLQIGVRPISAKCHQRQALQPGENPCRHRLVPLLAFIVPGSRIAPHSRVSFDD